MSIDVYASYPQERAVELVECLSRGLRALEEGVRVPILHHFDPAFPSIVDTGRLRNSWRL